MNLKCHWQLANKDRSLKRQHKHYMTLIWLGIALLLFLYWLFFWRVEVYTNDAYVQGNQVYITALHPGFVTSILTDDSFLVKKGQLIVTLDRTDASIALERAKKNLAGVVREICQAFHDVFVLEADIEKRRALLLKARQDFKHRYDVIDAKGVSLEDYQHAVDDLQASEAALKATQFSYHKANALIQGSSIEQHPFVQKAVQDVRDAWVRLYRCNIYAPVDGLVAQRTIQVGMWTKPNQPLLSVIPLDQIWVNANYKETQLKHMRLGQPVQLTSDLYGRNVVFHGKIVGLPGGAGNTFSLLPPENLSGNWIKIVQRLPVRVELKLSELQKHPLRIGLSMEAWTNLAEKTGLLVPVNSHGSPSYVTDIFKKEEEGSSVLIKQIIDANLDPLLHQYAKRPLVHTYHKSTTS